MVEKSATTADADTTRIERALPWKKEVAEFQGRDSAKVRDELRALRGELTALRANGEQLRQSEGQKQLAEIRALKALVEAQKGDAASLKADVSARFDRADRDAAQRGDKLAERVDRLEKRLSDPTPTASISRPAPATVVADAAKSEKTDRADKLPPPDKLDKPVRGIVLRDVSGGVALLETRRGMLEVVPGDSVPGAGRVTAIERQGRRWRVVTTTGIIDDVD